MSEQLVDVLREAGVSLETARDIAAEVASDVTRAWLAGFRTHRDGDATCPHGYGKGDHHWESGDCLALNRDVDDPALNRYICRHGYYVTEHWCDDHADHDPSQRACEREEGTA